MAAERVELSDCGARARVETTHDDGRPLSSSSSWSIDRNRWGRDELDRRWAGDRCGRCSVRRSGRPSVYVAVCTRLRVCLATEHRSVRHWRSQKLTGGGWPDRLRKAGGISHALLAHDPVWVRHNPKPKTQSLLRPLYYRYPWSLGYVGTTSSETPRYLLSQNFQASRTTSKSVGTHCWCIETGQSYTSFTVSSQVFLTNSKLFLLYCSIFIEYATSAGHYKNMYTSVYRYTVHRRPLRDWETASELFCSGGRRGEARRAESGGWGSWGGDSQPPPHQLWGLRERCISSLDGVRGGVRAAEGFSCILSRQIAFPSISVRVAYSLHIRY